MSAPLTRRAALGALAGVPALALPAFAKAASTPTLAALIEAHRAARAAFHVEIDNLEAADLPRGTTFVCLNMPPVELRYCKPDDAHKYVDNAFDLETQRLANLKKLSPEIGQAAILRLEEERAADHSRVDEAFAGYVAAKDRYSAACDAEVDALTAVCAHRCSSLAELAEKGRFLLDYIGEGNEITEDQQAALLGSFLPEGEAI